MANFAYMSGTGNDFLIGKYDGPVSEIQIIALVSDAEYEIDGVIFVEPINNLKVKMHYFNNDGSDAELCVNGVRCVAKYSLDNAYVDSNSFTVNAPVGDMNVSVNNDEVEIEAPVPTFDSNELIFKDTVGVKSSVGNPHFMIEVNDVDNTDLEDLNSKLIGSNNFPDGVNIEIYQLINNNYVKARVFERGVGETDACGSGALCMFNYLFKTQKLENNSYVMYPGGDLNLRFEDEKLFLSGEVIYL
ncbi:MAG: diaminopimelate epimerase [Actinobacteria bacterium]|nr:diaminopimelate epimerase [Actinomycetota bacterium]